MTPDDAVRIVRTQTIPSLARSGGGGHERKALEEVLLQLEEALRDLSCYRVTLTAEGIPRFVEWRERALKAEADLAELRSQVSHDPATCHVCRGGR